MSEQTGKPVRTGETASKAGRSYPEILQLNQELFKNLQSLIDEDEARKKELLDTKNAYEMAQAEIARLERELRQSIERESDRAEELTQLEQERVDQLGAMSAHLDAKQQELDELQNAQLQWAMDRQALLEQHESLKKGHGTLQQSHDRTQAEVGRLKDDLARARSRDEERAKERQVLLDQHESLKQG